MADPIETLEQPDKMKTLAGMKTELAAACLLFGVVVSVWHKICAS